MAFQNIREVWMNTIFKGSYSSEYQHENFLFVLLHQMCLFHHFRPEDLIFEELLKESSDREIKQKQSRIFHILQESQNLGYQEVFKRLLNDFLFIIEKTFQVQGLSLRFKKAFILSVSKLLKVTVILIKKNPKKTPEKIVFSAGELPVVVEKAQKKFFSINSVHITQKTQERCWPNLWVREEPKGFKIEKYLARITKHNNYSHQVYYAVEDFYCKFPWKERECFEYINKYAEVNNRVLYYPSKEAEKVEVYRCPYCKNLKRSEKTCLHCAVVRKDANVLMNEACFTCGCEITGQDFILFDENIWHLRCFKQ